MTSGSRDTGGAQRGFAPDFLTELFRNPLDPGYAAAAARRRVSPVTGRPRTGRAVTGVVLLVTSGNSKQQGAQQRPHVALAVGPANVQLAGSF